MPKRYQNPSKKMGLKVSKLDVAVTCSCPFWKWGGPDYNAKQNGFLFQSPRSDQSTPDIRDPERDNWVCKHAAAALAKADDYILTVTPKEG